MALGPYLTGRAESLLSEARTLARLGHETELAAVKKMQAAANYWRLAREAADMAAYLIKGRDDA